MKHIQSLHLTVGAICAALCLLAAPRAAAQATAKPPGKMTYQGFLTDANGVPLGNSAPTNCTVYFRIWTAATGGTLKWASQQTVTVDKGHFSVLLGEGSQVGSDPFTADLSSVFAGSDASDRYLEITVNGISITPRLQFLPSPYALLARTATQVVDNTGSNVLTAANGFVGINKANPVSALDVNATVTATSFSGSFSGAGSSLTGLDASALTSGTVPNARLDQNPTVSGNLTANAVFAPIIAATTVSGYGTIPIGGIIMWSGTSVPDGWALCNGQTVNGNQTPNLANRFIVASGGTYAVGNIGGNASIILSSNQLPAHTHSVNGGDFGPHQRTFQGEDGSTQHPFETNPGSGRKDTDAAGGGQSIDIRPPYYALAFIMRVK